MGILSRHKKEKQQAEELYKGIKEVYSPYFKQKVIFNSDGFHHLQFSARREREKVEQLLKFFLLRWAKEIVEKAGTVQFYRKEWIRFGKKSLGDGLQPLKEAEFWGFVALVGEAKEGVKVVLRRVGNGNVIFWSVMRADAKRASDPDLAND